jgi:hypothetical protein
MKPRQGWGKIQIQTFILILFLLLGSLLSVDVGNIANVSEASATIFIVRVHVYIDLGPLDPQRRG